MQAYQNHRDATNKQITNNTDNSATLTDIPRMRSTGKFQVITIGRMLSYQILSEGNEGKKKFEYLLHIIKCVFVLPAQVIHNHGCMVPTRTARDCMDENPCTVPWILPCMCHWVVQLTEFPWNGRGSMALFTCYNYPRWDCFNTSSRWVLKPARRPYNAHCRHRTHHGGSKNSGKYGAPKNFSPVFLDSSCKTRQVGGDQYHMNWVPYTCESDVHIIQTHGCWLVGWLSWHNPGQATCQKHLSNNLVYQSHSRILLHKITSPFLTSLHAIELQWEILQELSGVWVHQTMHFKLFTISSVFVTAIRPAIAEYSAANGVNWMK